MLTRDAPLRLVGRVYLGASSNSRCGWNGLTRAYPLNRSTREAPLRLRCLSTLLSAACPRRPLNRAKADVFVHPLKRGLPKAAANA